VEQSQARFAAIYYNMAHLLLLQTLYSAWSAGALAESYLKRFLATFSRQLNHVEQRCAHFAAIYSNTRI
jgi:hypothetical protein